MHQPVDVGQDFDKGAKVGDAHDFAGVDAPDFGGLGQRFDALAGHALALSPSVVAMKTEPSSSMSILAPVSSWMLRMILPPGPMMAPILSTGIWTTVMRGACGLSSGRGAEITSSILSRMDRRATRACCERLGHDLGGDALDLDVHLQGGDALDGAGDLEVHVAQVVFGAQDVGEDAVIARLP